MKYVARMLVDYSIGDLLVAAAGSLATSGDRRPPWGDLAPSRPYVLINNARNAIQVALQWLALPPHSLIGVPLYCCPTVFEAIVSAGHQPYFLDVDIETYNLSVAALQRDHRQLAGLVIVHMFGFPLDMTKVQEIIGDRPVIEDCAHAFGSRWEGRPVGEAGAAAAFSFGKWPYCRGGALFWDPDRVAANQAGTLPPANRPSLTRSSLVDWLHPWLHSHRNHGRRGMKSKLVVHAAEPRTDWYWPGSDPRDGHPQQMGHGDLAVLCRKVAAFPRRLAQQQAHARQVQTALADTEVVFPSVLPGASPNYYVLPLRFRNEAVVVEVARRLAAAGVQTNRYQRGVSQIAHQHFGYSGGCPNTLGVENTVLWVPFYHTLSDRDIERITDVIREVLREVNGKPA